ncbi:hypothetical protein ACS0TY_006534 [Phlomoides rotata]
MDRYQENSSKGTCRKIEQSDDRQKTTALRQVVVEDVNTKADNFIKNFRKQLRIERADSLKRYHRTQSKQVQE